MSIGLNAGLYLAANSLQAQTVGLTTTGNNISNANTPGATREVVNLEESEAINTTEGSLGTGSNATLVQSVRSNYLDNEVQQQTSQLNYAQTSEQQYTLLQQSFGEDITNNQVSATGSTSPTGTGIQNPLDQFYSAWQSLANNPSDSVYRDNVSSAAGELVNQISGAYNQILSGKGNSFTQASDVTQQVNQLSAQIATLNEQISRAEGQMVNGDSGINPQANSLRDQRQEAINQLSQYVNLQVVNNQGPLKDQTNIEIANSTGGSQTPPVYLVYQQYGAGATNGTTGTVRLDVVATNPTSTDGNTGTTSSNISGGAYDKTTNSVMTIVASTSTTTGTTPPSAPTLASITTAAPVTLAAGTSGQLATGLKTVSLFDNLSTSTNGSIPGGQLGALVDQANNVVGVGNGSSIGGSTVERFNNFVNQLVTEVNTQFNKGYNNNTTPTQPTGTATSTPTLTSADTLFSMTGTNASSLKLNSVYDINSSSYNRSDFPAAGAGTSGSLGSLDGSNASAIAQLAQTAAPTGTETNTTPAPTTYRAVIATIGSATAAATSSATQTNLLLQQTTTQDSSIEGINMDQEVANLTSYQQAYSASARFLTTVNSMLTYLIQDVGV